MQLKTSKLKGKFIDTFNRIVEYFFRLVNEFVSMIFSFVEMQIKNTSTLHVPQNAKKDMKTIDREKVVYGNSNSL